MLRKNKNQTDTVDRIQIIIAKDFNDAVGARDREDGPFSGQHFYEDHLSLKSNTFKFTNPHEFQKPKARPIFH